MSFTELIKKLSLQALLILICMPVSAVQRFQAHYTDSSWHVTSSPIHCELIHKIDRYGDGRFVFSSGGELAFQLHAIQASPRDSVASLHSEAPFWREPYQQELAQLTLNKGRMPIYIGGSLALRMLNELEQGRHPIFHYKDWADYKDDVYVSVSSVNFREKVLDFQRCIADALPYGPERVKDTAVYFAKNKHRLSREQRKQLDEIILFANFDRSMKIELVGHADGRGTRRYNLALSKKRTAAVEKYLKSKGIRSEQLITRAHGESRPQTSNRTQQGRSNNRRVDVVIKR